LELDSEYRLTTLAKLGLIIGLDIIGPGGWTRDDVFAAARDAQWKGWHWPAVAVTRQQPGNSSDVVFEVALQSKKAAGF
jgi:hypothetical protein